MGMIRRTLWSEANGQILNSDRPILIFFITDADTNYLHGYVPITDMQNQYLFTVIK